MSDEERMPTAIDYSRCMSEDELTEAIYLRISQDDRARLDKLANRLPLKMAAIARIALRIGLAEIERDPARIFIGAPPHTPVSDRIDATNRTKARTDKTSRGTSRTKR
jgi:hypothetical protein